MINILDRVINEWESDARHEHNANFYIPGAEVDRVLNGHRCYVTGRKGTGKTALARYIKFKKERSILLDFDRFKYQSFFNFKDDNYSASSKYVSVWVYVILMAALEAIYKKDATLIPKGSAVYERLNVTSKAGTIPIISRILSFLSGLKLNGGVFGIEGGVQFGSSREAKLFTVDEVNRILENTLRSIKNLKDDPIFVLVDDIDTDLNTKSLDKLEYKYLLSSLLDAALYVRGQDIFVMPVVFMREDLFKSLPNPNKWSDLRIRIAWNSETISAFIKNKIETLAQDASELDSGLQALFSEGTVRTGSKNRIDILDYIISYSQRRPRDVIKYIKIAAEHAKSMDLPKLSPAVAKDGEVLSHYSEYMSEEIRDELKYIYDDVDIVYGAIKACGNPRFRYSEISIHLKSYLSCDESKCVSVVHDLFDKGVIGNHVNEREIFIFTDPSSNIHLERGMLVHRSLLKIFQMY